MSKKVSNKILNETSSEALNMVEIRAERNKKYHQKYYQEHKEYFKKKYEENKGKYKERSKAFRKNNPEKTRQYNKRFYEKNRWKINFQREMKRGKYKFFLKIDGKYYGKKKQELPIENSMLNNQELFEMAKKIGYSSDNGARYYAKDLKEKFEVVKIKIGEKN